MAEKLARTRAKRGGNRSVMTKLSNEANDLLEVEPINKQRLDFIAASLNEKLNLVKTLDIYKVVSLPKKNQFLKFQNLRNVHGFQNVRTTVSDNLVHYP